MTGTVAFLIVLLVLVGASIPASVLCYKAGLNKPTKEAQAKLAKANEQLIQVNAKVESQQAELTRLEPLQVRIRQTKYQEQVVQEFKDRINSAQATITRLTQEIHRLRLQVVNLPNIADITQQEIDVLVIEQLEAQNSLPNLRMDLANAEVRLRELVDNLAAKRAELLPKQ